MIKRLIITCLITVFVTILISSYNQTSDSAAKPKLIVNNSYTHPQESKEDLYEHIFITLLMPYVDKAIDEFYSQYLTYLPQEDPWFVQILSAERTSGSSFNFLIKIEIAPYIGPHNSVGIDHITFEVDATGKVTVKKFEHIKSFPIAPNYQHIIKKWPPS